MLTRLDSLKCEMNMGYSIGVPGVAALAANIVRMTAICHPKFRFN
jgi:hypothetical protein